MLNGTLHHSQLVRALHVRTEAACRRLSRSSKGNALMEFAICAPPFMALLLACAQFALIYFAQQGVQTSAEMMARRLMTGELRQSNTSAAQFKTAACLTLPTYMQCSKLTIDARQASTFAGIDAATPSYTYDASGKVTNAQFSTGTAGSIVILRLLYPWSTVSGPLGLNMSNQATGPRLLIGTMVFQSEPYQ